MYLITFRARINPRSKIAATEFDGVGGAYVNCWINFKDYDASEKLAKILLRERGFIAEIKTDASVVRKKELETNEEQQFYGEAIKYGYTLVFHLWPKDAPDAETD